MPINFVARFIFVFIGLAISKLGLAAPLRVVTTTSDLASIVESIGGAEVSVESLAKGTQDPHYLEAKPSYMLKLNKADLLISIGLDLETAWLSHVVRGARNPQLNAGAIGQLEVGPLVERLEKPEGEISRADGDVHPEGNPHVLLDPLRAITISKAITERLSRLRPQKQKSFEDAFLALEKKIKNSLILWTQRMEKTAIKKVVTHHRTLSYFLDRFGIETAELLEPKPGIPPTSAHIIRVVKTIRDEKIPLILIENYFDPSPLKKIRQKVPGIRGAVVPVSVGGTSEIRDLHDLYETLVKTFEGAE